MSVSALTFSPVARMTGLPVMGLLLQSSMAVLLVDAGAACPDLLGLPLPPPSPLEDGERVGGSEV
jgi:hypothetical protein